MFKPFNSLKDKVPLRWNKPVNECDEAPVDAQDPGFLQSSFQKLNLPREYWHNKLESFYKDQFNPKDGFAQHVRQTVSMPKEWMLGLIDEGKPNPEPLTAEELERAAVWAKFLAPESGNAKANYVYEPLSSVSTLSTRLVRLLPGEDLEDIQLVVECVELDNCVSYEALSYCWGEPSVKTIIHCNGGSLLVTTNLKSALLYLRRKTGDRLLWIDALCINQEDLQERSQQVGIMSHIYRKASGTIVWLGEEAQNSSLGIDLCEKLYEFFKDEKTCLQPKSQFNFRTLWSSDHHDPFNPSHAQTDEGDFKKRTTEGNTESDKGDEYKKFEDSSKGLPLRMNPPNVYELLALRDLARRQWFRRIWIAQELALASQVTMVCGYRSISWDIFVYGFAMTFVSGHRISGGWDRDQNFIGPLVQIRESIQGGAPDQYQYPATLLDRLHGCRSFEATDPRDKVYGLLGVAPLDDKAISVKVDYGKTAEEVYVGLAHVILSSSGNLDLLSIPHGDSQLGKHRLPSWVPDWSYTSSPSLDLVFPASKRKSPSGPIREFAATRGSTSTPMFKDPQILVLSGYIVDNIAQLSEIIQAPIADTLRMKLLDQKLDDEKSVLEAEGLAGMSVYFDIMMSIEDLALGGGNENSIYPTSEPRTRAFWRTLCTDTTYDSLDAGDLAFTGWRQALKAPRVLKRFRVDKFTRLYNYLAAVGFGVTNTLHESDGLFEIMMQPAFYNRFAITRDGYFAMVPPATKVGDQVGLFKGGKVPLIIRQKDDQWSLVGESYVHGIMHGEAFNEARSTELELI
ncbi:heterokaryon incompatibility protein-domain-containing protein [Bisporella sp. PMI_857]|nr:heterokaryon incompatibility protein-domain-containing protein [Bisporella sp. PMI_857]